MPSHTARLPHERCSRYERKAALMASLQAWRANLAADCLAYTVLHAPRICRAQRLYVASLATQQRCLSESVTLLLIRAQMPNVCTDQRELSFSPRSSNHRQFMIASCAGEYHNSTLPKTTHQAVASQLAYLLRVWLSLQLADRSDACMICLTANTSACCKRLWIVNQCCASP